MTKDEKDTLLDIVMLPFVGIGLIILFPFFIIVMIVFHLRYKFFNKIP